MRAARLVPIALLALAVACSGGAPVDTGRFAVPPTAKGGGGSPGSVAVQTLPRGRLDPPSPARLFAGTASTVGDLTHYCKNSTCEEGAAGTPTFLSAPTGSFIVFTIGASPVEAVAEIRVTPGEKPSTVRLNPGTLMYFSHGLTSGRYLVDLVVRWRASEARWRFGLKVTG